MNLTRHKPHRSRSQHAQAQVAQVEPALYEIEAIRTELLDSTQRLEALRNRLPQGLKPLVEKELAGSCTATDQAEGTEGTLSRKVRSSLHTHAPTGSTWTYSCVLVYVHMLDFQVPPSLNTLCRTFNAREDVATGIQGMN